MAKASVHTVDMTNVADSGQRVNPKHMPEGDYLARITSVEDAPVKKGENKGDHQWLFIIQLESKASAKYPYYCQLKDNQLWKVRNLLVAAGINVPKKKVKLDPERVVGKLIAVTLEDEEYEGKMKSVIGAIFPASELSDVNSSPSGDDSDDSDDDDDDDDDDTTSTDSDDDDDEDEAHTWGNIAELDRAALKQFNADNELGVKVKKSMSDNDLRAAIAAAANITVPQETEDDDDDDDAEEETPTPPKKKDKKKTKAVSDEELEELDIDEV